jgi:hypothetical protein
MGKPTPITYYLLPITRCQPIMCITLKVKCYVILAAMRDFNASIASGVASVVCHAGRAIKRSHQALNLG